MLRITITAVLITSSAPASAQTIRDVAKTIKYGVGCVEPIKQLAPRLGICLVGGPAFRIWCPNGRVFERNGEEPQTHLVRSICSLNQILEK